jgi:hypothetical protein
MQQQQQQQQQQQRKQVNSLYVCYCHGSLWQALPLGKCPL